MTVNHEYNMKRNQTLLTTCTSCEEDALASQDGVEDSGLLFAQLP